MAENISDRVSWVDRVVKRYHDLGELIPSNQLKLYQKISDHYTQGRTVIDIGCSTGVGANILSHNARFVWGVDMNEEAIDWATRMFKRPNLDFAVLDVEHPTDRELSKFEVLVMSEVIEHLGDVEVGLQTIKRFFTPETYGFITVPNINNEEVRARDTANELHLQHWSAGDFYALMIKHFQNVVMFSAEKLSVWDHEETIDGNSTDGLIVARVKGIL